MKLLLPFLIAALVALPVAGCATGTVNVAAAQAAGDTCRMLPGQNGEPDQVYCGNAEQWAELDRRAALINAGVTCRFARTPQEVCLPDDQWEEYDRRVAQYAAINRPGPTMEAGAFSGSNYDYSFSMMSPTTVP